MSRKCYHFHDLVAGRVLIPGCWPVVHSNNMEDCTCRLHPETEKEFARKEYNETLAAKNRYIKELEKEVAQLNRILGKIYKKRRK